MPCAGVTGVATVNVSARSPAGASPLPSGAVPADCPPATVLAVAPVVVVASAASCCEKRECDHARSESS